MNYHGYHQMERMETKVSPLVVFSDGKEKKMKVTLVL